jgi:hypothetical protein
MSGTYTSSPDFPYEWSLWNTLEEATVEYNIKGTQITRGLVSGFDGVFIVFWSKN